MIKVLFFARLREQLGCAELQVQYANLMDTDLLRRQLLEHHPQWQEFFDQQILVALNQTLVKGNHPLGDGDEVAFFPPVTGG